MNLHRNLAQAQVGSYLLIQLSGHYPCDHLLLTGTKRYAIQFRGFAARRMSKSNDKD
jgi:hypothetical protein